MISVAVPETRLVASPPLSPKASIIPMSVRNATGVKTAINRADFLGDGVWSEEGAVAAGGLSESGPIAVTEAPIVFRLSKNAEITVTLPMIKNKGAPSVRMLEVSIPAADAEMAGAP